ncbi:ABC transporter permease [Teredinibacter haidensis]|uniref:ABC transporter permease n=1 Tax=Teredinibacter haidensis TaxID=2731755 RepID=UPI000948C731|nr:ABC transporter permease [Teredinibacter haidensis]
MELDNLQEILFTLRKNKLRTFLTAFGVFWGILMLILLLGAGKGLERGISAGFGSDDRSSIWIRSGKTAIPYRGVPHGRQIEFDEDDIAALRREFDGLQFLSAENTAGERWRSTINVTHKEKSGAYRVLGVADEYFNIKRFLDYRAGRTLNLLDTGEIRKVAIIGTAVRDYLFGEGVDPVGETVTFHGIVLTVVGVFYDSGREGRMSERVYIPLSTFQKTFGRANKIGQITLTPKEGVDSYDLEDRVIEFLKQRHRVAPDDVRGIRAFNFARQTEDTTKVFSAITAFIWFVGLGTLMAGIVGISNIMIITVKDRTREIGVRKALGATPRSIVFMVLTESILVTAVAGYFGLVLGVGILEGVAVLVASAGGSIGFFGAPEIDIGVAFTSVVILVAAGTLAGLAPAIHAAKIHPIEAMREE